MPNLFENAASWLGQRLQQAAGQAVVYQRGGRDPISLTGTPVKQEYTVFDEEGAPTVVVAYDFIFTAEELGLVPRPGDEATAPLNGTSNTFEVMPIGTKPCWERLDTSGVLILVHTKKVG